MSAIGGADNNVLAQLITGVGVLALLMVVATSVYLLSCHRTQQRTVTPVTPRPEYVTLQHFCIFSNGKFISVVNNNFYLTVQQS